MMMGSISFGMTGSQQFCSLAKSKPLSRFSPFFYTSNWLFYRPIPHILWPKKSTVETSNMKMFLPYVGKKRVAIKTIKHLHRKGGNFLFFST